MFTGLVLTAAVQFYASFQTADGETFWGARRSFDNMAMCLRFEEKFNQAGREGAFGNLILIETSCEEGDPEDLEKREM